MSDESTLRKKAREAIRAGKLPNRRPERMWGGRGAGAYCAICDQPVEHDEVEYELQFAPDGDGRALDNYHVHIRCFAAWEFEHQNLKVAPGSISSTDEPRSATPAAMSGGASESN